MDDIEGSILHLRVRQDNTWSLDKTVSAGRELGRTAECSLASLPRLIVPPGDNPVIAPAYLEYRMTAFTSLAKKRPNPDLKVPRMPVPSAGSRGLWDPATGTVQNRVARASETVNAKKRLH